MRAETLKYYTRLEQAGLIKRENCTAEETEKYKDTNANVLPDNIFRVSNTDTFIKYPPKDELQLELSLKSTKDISTIKNCMVFITVLIILGIIFTIIPLFAVL